MRDCKAAVDDYKERIEELEETNELIKIDVGLLKGVVQTQERHIASLQEQMTDMKARSMSNNITITGIEEHPDEDCKSLAKHFLTEKRSLEVQTEDIQVAHRIGMKDAKDRQMVVKLSSKIRGKVFSYTKNLKGKKNSQNNSYYVDPQLPEQQTAERRENNFHIRNLKRVNQDLPPGQKAVFSVRNRKLFVNNEEEPLWWSCILQLYKR